MSGGSRLERRFADRAGDGRRALILFIAAADPAVALTPALLHALVAGGADIIELGYPYCDPILDGPVIRQANRRSLDAGGTLDTALHAVAAFREEDDDTPIILMGYANPVLSRPVSLFEKMAVAGVDGLIIPDLPLREADMILPAIDSAGMSLVPLVPPTAFADEARLGDPGVGGFVYAIAQAGPTGGAAPTASGIEAAVARCRGLASLPVVVGFGIKTPDSAAMVARHADGVVVGSALVEFIQRLSMSGMSDHDLLSCVTVYVARFRQALDAMTAA